jgi:hypothetical protein
MHYTGRNPPFVPFIGQEPKKRIQGTTALSSEVLLEPDAGPDGKRRLGLDGFESWPSAFRFSFEDEKRIQHVCVWERTVPQTLGRVYFRVTVE